MVRQGVSQMVQVILQEEIEGKAIIAEEEAEAIVEEGAVSMGGLELEAQNSRHQPYRHILFPRTEAASGRA